MKPTELTEKLYRECGERWGAPGAIAGCLLEQEKALAARCLLLTTLQRLEELRQLVD